MFAPLLAALVAAPLHSRKTRFKPLDRLPDHATVTLQLGFTRTAQTNTALLAFKVSPAAHQTSGQMVKLSQLDLQLAFKGAGAQGKNIEYQAGTVDHALLERIFKIFLLTRAEVVIDQNKVGFHLLYKLGKLIKFALRLSENAGWPFAARQSRCPASSAPADSSQRCKLLPVFLGNLVADTNVAEEQHVLRAEGAQTIKRSAGVGLCAPRYRTSHRALCCIITSVLSTDTSGLI